MRILIFVLVLYSPLAAQAASADGRWTTGCIASGNAFRITTMVLEKGRARILSNLYRDSRCIDHKVLEHVEGQYALMASGGTTRFRFTPSTTTFLVYTRKSQAEVQRQTTCGVSDWPYMAEQPVSGIDNCMGLAVPRTGIPVTVAAERPQAGQLVLEGPAFWTARDAPESKFHKIEAEDTARAEKAAAAVGDYMMTRWSTPDADDLHDPAVVTRLISEMAEKDQFIRFFVIRRPVDLAYNPAERAIFEKLVTRQMSTVDGRNIERLKDIIAIHGWPKTSAFGSRASMNAWTLVQHADQDPEFQHRVLELMKPLLAENEVSKRNYAYLYDRLATSFDDESKRRLQRFGTQGRCTGKGEWRAFPSEDEDRLDDRRKEMGLEPIADYAAGASRFCN